MSTTFTLHRTKDETLFAAPDKVVELTERSARFDLDLDGYAEWVPTKCGALSK